MTTEHFLDWVERKAFRLRDFLKLSPTDILDPYRLARRMGAKILSPYDVVGLSDSDINELLCENSSCWSAGTVRLPNRQIVIVLNPTHPDTRKRATLMEELSHMHLNHKPTDLIILEGEFAMRCYKKTQETEAYWVGAAALLPKAVLQYARINRINKGLLAEEYGVSKDLVGFRTRVTGIAII